MQLSRQSITKHCSITQKPRNLMVSPCGATVWPPAGRRDFTAWLSYKCTLPASARCPSGRPGAPPFETGPKCHGRSIAHERSQFSQGRRWCQRRTASSIGPKEFRQYGPKRRPSLVRVNQLSILSIKVYKATKTKTRLARGGSGRSDRFPPSTNWKDLPLS